jgi:flagellin-like protein
MMNYRKFRKNAKAISPVISVLLMIAVAVAASLVTYAWVMGYLNFTTTKVGKAIQIQSIAKSGMVYVQNVGESTVTLTEAYLDGTKLATSTFTPSATIGVGETASVDVSLADFANGQTVVVKITTEDGTFAELTKTFP